MMSSITKKNNAPSEPKQQPSKEMEEVYMQRLQRLDAMFQELRLIKAMQEEMQELVRLK